MAFLGCLSSAGVFSKVSSFWGVGIWTSSSLVRGLVVALFLTLLRLTIYMHSLEFSQFQVDPYRHHFLCVMLSNSSCCRFPKFWSLLRALFVIPLPVVQFRKHPQAKASDCGPYLVFFPSLRDDSPCYVLSNVWKQLFAVFFPV